MATCKIIFIYVLVIATLTNLCLSQPDFVVALPAKDNDPIKDAVVHDSGGQVLIVGGEEAIKNEFPGIVNLLITTTSAPFSCGGNILNASWILTAAHCLWPLKYIRSISVTAGDHYKDEIEATEQTRNGKNWIISPSLNETTLAGDIALVELETPFTINEYVQETTLANPNFDATGAAIIAGWGHTSNNGTETNELRKADVTFVPNSVCSENFEGIVPITDSMVCASGVDRGICNGDSGGPLMVRSELTKGTFLVGITSFGDEDGCGNDAYPDVFERVSSHVAWIQSLVDNVKIHPDVTPPTTTTEQITTTALMTTSTLRATTVTDEPGGENGVEKTSNNVLVQLFIIGVWFYRIGIS